MASADGTFAIFKPAAPAIQVDRVLRIQGYADLQRVRPAILKAAVAMTDLAPILSAPKVAYRRLSVRGLSSGTLELEGGFRLSCSVFDRTLRGCTEAIVFVLTVGRHLDERVVELVAAGDLLEALLLETTGWLCIEDATRQFKTRIREDSLLRGDRITSRLGPGYTYKVGSEMCTWSLEDQPALFAALGAGELPVALMSSCAMQPKMSRSGMFGVAPLSTVADNGSRHADYLRAVPTA